MSVHEFYRLKALITLEQVNTTKWSKKKEESLDVDKCSNGSHDCHPNATCWEIPLETSHAPVSQVSLEMAVGVMV